jgi:hypothetical protein
MGGWLVVVSSAKFVDELIKATDNELSQPQSVIDVKISTMVWDHLS